MCWIHSKNHMKMRFSTVQGTPKIVHKSSKFPSRNIPKSTLNRSRKPSKTTLRKSAPKKHRKIKKVPKMTSQRGVPGCTSNVVFAHFGAPGLPWGPPWLPDLAQGPPGPLRTLIFGDSRSIFGDFCAFGTVFGGF